MNNCKDCIHYEVCEDWIKNTDYEHGTVLDDACDCPFFEEKSRFAPVVESEWKNDECMACHKWSSFDYKFCPNCGAVMKNGKRYGS